MRNRPVLVIDNDAETVKKIADALKPLGFPVVAAASGEEGLNAAKNTSPLLILINLGVSGTDGLAICKSFISIIDAPLILLTMREGKYDPRYRTQYGIVDFVKKPVSVRDLTFKVTKYASAGPEEQVTTMTPDETDELDIADEAEAIEMVEEEAPSVAELAASATKFASGKKSRSIDDEEIEAVEIIPDGELTDTVEVVEAIPAYESPEASEGTEETDEWPIADDDISDTAPQEKVSPWDMSATEMEAHSPEEADTPNWSMDDDEQSFKEAPNAEDVDWSELEEEPLEESDAQVDETPPGEDLFGGESSQSRPYIKEEEPFALDDEEPYELPPEDREYEVRPAALEREKRRKSQSRLLVPLLILLLVCAIGAGVYFFFIAGQGTGIKPVSKKPAPAVSERAEPTTEEVAPTEEKPSAPARKTAPPQANAEKKPVRVEKRPAVTKTSPPPSSESSGKNFYVQFGAFRSKENSIKFQSQLKELGYETTIKEQTVSGQPLYLVLLSTSFTDKWTAFKQARQIKEKSDIGTAVHVE